MSGPPLSSRIASALIRRHELCASAKFRPWPGPVASTRRRGASGAEEADADAASGTSAAATQRACPQDSDG
jgi:hypothetical protein